MRKLYYMGLEKLQARYTLQLTDWNISVFKDRSIDYEIITGDDLTGDQIVTGSVLDAHGRSYFSLTQVANLIKLMQQGKVTSEDVVFFEDAFTPGIESLFYIIDQVPLQYRPRIYVRFLAQTTDPDDFVNREGMFNWMRPFEQMLDAKVTAILVANEEFVAHLRIAGFKAPIYVTGLPFGKAEVISRVIPKRIEQRTDRVCFAARFDSEKQPHLFMQLAEEYFKIDPSIEFAVFTGRKELTSNDPEILKHALQLADSNGVNFKIYTGLNKNQYYELLADSRVLVDTSLQNWVSNCISEADTLGTLVLYPAYRSFPETLANNERCMYVPWSLVDMINKLTDMLVRPYMYPTGDISDWQDGTIDRTIDIFEGKGEQWARNTLDYRKWVSVPKFFW